MCATSWAVVFTSCSVLFTLYYPDTAMFGLANVYLISRLGLMFLSARLRGPKIGMLIYRVDIMLCAVVHVWRCISKFPSSIYLWLCRNRQHPRVKRVTGIGCHSVTSLDPNVQTCVIQDGSASQVVEATVK
ncbi:hypothetical protein K431DRAFT_73333 [Polychaeton citri CBS 116435]|uniref:Uncharacterized protein n=1 Tax=Polychaeton citri CBS 116435 TaxID=1314669 RepID=A0A9P4Q864_9PEZI|nr:hypothetical protein K431DRAFT_73333 [Polychaeton citri CBS 116435]